MLDQLIADSPIAAFERTTLPRGIEAKLAKEEYRLYSELKRAINNTTINDEDNNLGFNFGSFVLMFEDGRILVSKGKQIFARYTISDFSRSPNAVFRQMQKEFSRIETTRQES